MKEIKTEDAIGSVLCHDNTEIVKDQRKGPRFKKGHIIKEEDIEVLLNLGKEHLYVFEKDETMIHENDAAEILCNLCFNEYMKKSAISEGNIELTTIDNKNALAIHTSDNYITYLYQDNNKLKEFFTQETTKPTLASGDAIMDLDDLKIEKVNDHLIKLTFYYSSFEEETYVSIL